MPKKTRWKFIIARKCTALHQFADAQNISEIAPKDLPLDVVPFLYPSRYCESDRLMRLAYDEFKSYLPGFSRVTAICNYIHERISYERGSSVVVHKHRLMIP